MFAISRQSKELQITPKSLKVAKTPEEHKLLSKLSKVKSLWEGSDTHGSQSSCPNPETIDELETTEDVTLEQRGSVGHSVSDTTLPEKTEAWASVSETENKKDHTEVVRMSQGELDESAGEAPNDTASLTENNSAVSSETVSKEERSSSCGPVAEDENLEDQSGKCDQEHSQKSEQRPPSDAKGSMASEEVPRQKTTRRGGRGRRPKGPGPRQNENAYGGNRTPEKQEKSTAGNATKGKNTPTRSHPQKGYDDFKDGDPNTDRTPEKQEKSTAGNATKGKNTATRSHPQKDYDDFKDGDPNADRTAEKQEKATGGNATKSKNTPTRSHHQKGYDDFKDGGPNADRTPEKQEKASGGNATKSRNTPTRSHHQKGYDDFKDGDPNADRTPEKQEKATGGNATKSRNTPTRSRNPKGNDDFRGDVPKASPKKPRVERSDGSQGDSPSARGGAESTPRQLTRTVETSEKGGDEKGTPDAKKQDSVKNTRSGNPANSPGDSGKGGAPNRGRRRPRSRTSKGAPGDEKQDTRNRSNSTPEKRPPKNP